MTVQGPEFVNEVNVIICKEFSIECSLCSPYYPQTNGLTERCNQTLINILTKYVNSNTNNLDKLIKWAVMSYRANMQASSKYSPILCYLESKCDYQLNMIQIRLVTQRRISPKKLHVENEEYARDNDAANTFLDLLCTSELEEVKESFEYKRFEFSCKKMLFLSDILFFHLM